jgi:hypothetical protein
MSSIIVGETSPFLSGSSSGSFDASTREYTASLTYVVPNLGDAITYNNGNKHPELDIPEVSRSWTQLEGCMGYELTIKYEGKREDDPTDIDDYTLDVSFSEEPIQSHPKWPEIRKKYKGSVIEDKVEFPEFIRLPKKDNTQSGGKGGTVKNPMYGQTTWLALKAVVRHSYVARQRPSLSMIGRIVKKAPGGFDTPDGHDWLVMPPKARRKTGGTDPANELFDITVEYLLSPLGGWPETVYEIMEGKFSPDEQKEREFNAPRLPDTPFAPKTGWNL